MSVNRFDDLCDKLDAAVFNGDWLFDAENRSIFEEYLRRWDIELKSHVAASESNSDYAALLDRHNELKEATRGLRDGLRLIHSGDHEDGAHSVAGYTLNLWRKELDALVGEGK